MKAKIYITLKDGIHDPQGHAVHRSLQTLGFQDVKAIRVGKLLELELGEMEKTSADTQINSMCQKLLANTVIEDFRYELVDS